MTYGLENRCSIQLSYGCVIRQKYENRVEGQIFSIFDQTLSPLARLKKQLHLILYRKYSSNIKFVMMALCVIIVTLFLPKQARFRFEYERGKTWQQKDLFSPYSFAIKKDRKSVV